MTSNIGARDLQKMSKGFGFATDKKEVDYRSMKSTVEDALKRVFNPEFLNRIDDVIVFHPLEKAHIFEIIEIMAADLFNRVKDLGIGIKLTQKAKDFLVEKGYDQKFGARPLRRAIQKYVEDPMAELILTNNLGENDLITIDHVKSKGEELSLKSKKGGAKKKVATKAKADKVDETEIKPEEAAPSSDD